jgi:NADPH:quinone reductase-like Zn-dependent oxidoreductase
MKAIGRYSPLPISEDQALIELEVFEPTPDPRDLLVAVRAVSVNPVNVKLRSSSAPPKGKARILGYDAAGEVESVGSEVRQFKPGDEVYYAGTIDRPGTNTELHLVDERIAGRKPTSHPRSQRHT